MSNQLTTTSPVSLFRTKTFWSLTLILLGQILPRYAKTFDMPGLVDYILTWVEITTLIAGFLAGNWSRLHATKTAALSPPAPPSPPGPPPATDEIKPSGPPMGAGGG